MGASAAVGQKIADAIIEESDKNGLVNVVMEDTKNTEVVSDDKEVTSLSHVDETRDETKVKLCAKNPSIEEIIENLQASLNKKDEGKINQIFNAILKLPQYAADNLSANDYNLDNKIFLLEMVLDTLVVRQQNKENMR